MLHNIWLFSKNILGNPLHLVRETRYLKSVPYIYPMDLARRDEILLLLQKEIQSNKRQILEYLEDAEKTQKENRFFDGIRDDYVRYRNHIVAEKERERVQMELLIEYLERILEETELSLEEANRARYEQNRILGQLEEVKRELDELVS